MAHLLLVLIVMNLAVSKLETLDLEDLVPFTPKLPYSRVLDRFRVQLKEDSKPNKSGDLRDPQLSN